MTTNYSRILIAGVLSLFLVACGREDKKFQLVESDHSGVTFKNVLTETADFNIINYMYFYNGGGVSTGDVNGDGLADIYFTGNQVPNKLYINKGNLKFEDVTEASGVEGFKSWCTGVTMADVNNDGKLDIYVGYLGNYLIYNSKNQLFINEGNDEKGIPKFTDRAYEYGLDLVGFSTQATFFDYDRDGDLDMYMLNHSLHQNGTFGRSTLRKTAHPLAGDKLLRNDDGHFTNVSSEAGIYSSVIGYGLGIAISDINLDGWPDIYVGNDFHENDYLYINQKNGTFVESAETAFMHTSRFAMGIDLADFNNDAFPDVISTDMLPNDPQILKASGAEDAYDVYQFKIGFGYQNQLARNTLQLNNQNGTFSDIAVLADVYATDWSWSGLFGDFDLDGFKDIYITNGIYRRPNNLDYINYISNDSIQMAMEGKLKDQDLNIIKLMPQIKIANFLYRNNHDSTFSNKADTWGLDKPSYSNGSSYSDLDNDGDLDLVVNNIEDEAFIYENKTRSKEQTDGKSNHFISVTLKGIGANLLAVGTKVFVYDHGTVQMLENFTTRGFQSSVDPKLIFGIGDQTEIDSLVIVWPDATYQTVKDVKGDQFLKFEQQQGAKTFDYSSFHKPAKFLLSKVDSIISYTHSENNSFDEFTREGLLPHMVSAEGPGSAVGDVNNDGLDDIFVGGGKWVAGKIFIQTIQESFKESDQPQLILDSTYEDTGALFIDVDKDSDKDLIVVSGGNEFTRNSKFAKSRVYLNDGKGLFNVKRELPVSGTGACVRACDVDHDGDLDLFFGTRTLAYRYGINPDSYLLINDGKGNFEDKSPQLAPDLKGLAMVKDAVWADIDKNGFEDLVIAGEWSPITILYNDKGKLTLADNSTNGLDKSNGWWNVIMPLDVDNDGDIDFIAGNQGDNFKLKPSLEEPVKLYVKDFDKNDSLDHILTHYMKGREYPFHTRDEMSKQMPFLKKKFPSYEKFSKATVEEMFSSEQLQESVKRIAYTFNTSIIENLGNSKFAVKPLPKAAQISTVDAMEILDVNNDGIKDVVLAGNFYPVNIQMGRNDASYGLVLLGTKTGNLEPLPAIRSGLCVKGEVRHIEKIKVGNSEFLFMIRNNNSMETYKINLQ